MESTSSVLRNRVQKLPGLKMMTSLNKGRVDNLERVPGRVARANTNKKKSRFSAALGLLTFFQAEAKELYISQDLVAPRRKE